MLREMIWRFCRIAHWWEMKRQYAKKNENEGGFVMPFLGFSQMGEETLSLCIMLGSF